METEDLIKAELDAPQTPVSEWLRAGLHEALHKIHAKEADELERGFVGWVPEELGGLEDQGEPRVRLLSLCKYLGQVLDSRQVDIEDLRKRAADFSRHFSRATTDDERAEFVMDFAKALGASERKLKSDRRALARWFGNDAVMERFQRKVAAHERMMIYCLERLAALVPELLGNITDDEREALLWKALAAEDFILPVLTYAGDERVRLAAFRALSHSVRALPKQLQETAISYESIQFIYRSAMDRRQNVWIQSEALKALESLSRDAMVTVLSDRISHPADGDDIFVRARVVDLLGVHVLRMAELRPMLGRAAEDPSPYVRQAAARALRKAPEPIVQQVLPFLTLMDDVAEVRAAMVAEMAHLIRRRELYDSLHDLLLAVFDGEPDNFVMRVALHTAQRCHLALFIAGQPMLAEIWHKDFTQAMDRVNREHESLTVRRWAAQERERLWVSGRPQRLSLHNMLRDRVRGVPFSKMIELEAELFDDIDEEEICRILAVLSEDDFGFEIQQLKDGRWRLRHHHQFGWRLWRVWTELNTPATDKRQAFQHTIGRRFRGRVHVPSPKMSELSETRVPGEPLFLSSEGGWRPYLPLPDAVLSALDLRHRGQPVRFYSAEGVTELTPPKSPWRRLIAKLKITFRFPDFSRLRNWREDDTAPATAYVDELAKHGIQLSFRGHMIADEARQPDPSVVRFFPAAGFFSLDILWRDFTDYFVSIYQNTLRELLLFLVMMSVLFFGRHIWISQKMRRMRNRMPLVIGGWGTRGKSGTERLKAGLLNAMGYDVMSKTTGCEAMFVHGWAHGQLRELFLYRPYDKATIWEQVNVMKIADKLKSECFLWECMGLTPSYVHVLQKQWMRDDIATITNTYPDHEDLQGPAGINIPQAMTYFIPENSLLITSEEQMTPVLEDAARKVNTEVQRIGWSEAGMIPPDILERFPYEEHPYNIALVAKMASNIGMPTDVAWKEMADRVVADLGVLKTYPDAPIRGRKLQFVMGMSANERLGCMGNWERMGFDKHNPLDAPGTFITTVVNNRADRVARSNVFASILVNDLQADRHFLIGTNLDGLQSFMRDAWDETMADISLWSSADEGGKPTDMLESWARRLRIPTDASQVNQRLQAMLEGLGMKDASGYTDIWQDKGQLVVELDTLGLTDFADDIVSAIDRYATELSEYQKFHERVASAGGAVNTELDHQFHKQLWDWFSSHLVIVEDVHASGNEIIDLIARETPPGYLNRIMGLQNIKGTGLGFVYAFQAWESCHQASQMLVHEDPAISEQGLRTLSGFQEFNLLSDEFIRKLIEEVQHSEQAQSELYQAELRLIIEQLDAQMTALAEKAGGNKSVGTLAKVANALESFLDAGDAIKRRKESDRIYVDLEREQISHARAALELQKINKRQKGGWLVERIYNVLNYILPKRPPKNDDDGDSAEPSTEA